MRLPNISQPKTRSPHGSLSAASSIPAPGKPQPSSSPPGNHGRSSTANSPETGNNSPKNSKVEDSGQRRTATKGDEGIRELASSRPNLGGKIGQGIKSRDVRGVTFHLSVTRAHT